VALRHTLLRHPRSHEGPRSTPRGSHGSE